MTDTLTEAEKAKLVLGILLDTYKKHLGKKESSEFDIITWKKDAENNTIEGWVYGKKVFDIEVKKNFARLYGKKKQVVTQLPFKQQPKPNLDAMMF